MISVIVPVYNAEEWLPRCVDSILGQSYTDFELLLIDDGSTDASGQICDDYAAKHACVKVFHKPNGGVSSARNWGIEQAKGDWIAFCDADDYVTEDWLQIFSKGMDGSLLICQGITLIDKDSNKRHAGISCRGGVSSCLHPLIEYGMLGVCWNKLFKKSLIQNVSLRFNENFRFKEDEDFVLKYIYEIEDSYIISFKEGGYVYYIPDFNLKYRNVKQYDALASIFTTVQRIHLQIPIKDAYEHYIKEYGNALVDSFLYKKGRNGIERIKKYQELVGIENIRRARWLGSILKRVLSLNPYLAWAVLKVGSVLQRMRKSV